MRSANCTSVVLTALLACACDSNPSGSDAQSHPGAGQTPPVLGAPQNLHAIRAPLIVGLFWNPVDGATSYVISGIPHVRGGVAQLIGEVTSTGVAIRFTSDAFPIDFAVTAKSAAGLGGPTGIFVPLPPSLDAHILRGVDVALSWNADAAYGSAVSVGRGADADHLATLATTGGTSYFDSSGTAATTYSYEVRLGFGSLVGFSNAVGVTTGLPAPVSVAATPLENHVRLDWTPVAGANFYRTSFQRSSGTGFVDLPGALTTDTEQVLPGERVTATVVAIDARGIEGLTSAAVPGRSLPETPVTQTPSNIDRVTLSWKAPVDADLVLIERTLDMTGASFVEIARTSATSFVDDAAPPWTPVLYRLTALDTAARLASIPVVMRSFVTEAPDQANLGPGDELEFAPGLPSISLPGQSFTVGRGGQLMGIEVKNKGVGSFALSLRDQDATLVSGIRVTQFFSDVPAPFPLLADFVVGNYFDLSSAGIFVSPGEKLRFELDGNEVASATGDLLSGGSLTALGAADAGRDLVFKAFVRSTPDLPLPAIVFSRGGSSSVELAWQGSPAATSYDVLLSQPAGNPAVAVTTADTALVVPGLSPGSKASFTVRATAADGRTAESAPVSVDVPPWAVDQANLADAFDALGSLWFVSTNGGVSFPSTQVVTANATGQLAGVEFAPSGTGDVTVEVLDGAQQVLGTAVLPGPHPPSSAEPLSPVQPGPGFVDLTALGIQVTAGQQLGFRLSTPESVSFRSCACTVPGATLLDPSGFPAAGRALAFKTYVVR